MTPNQIAAIRRSLGLSLRDFADRLGVSHVAVLHWESGQRRPGGPAMIVLRQLERKAAKKSPAA